MIQFLIWLINFVVQLITLVVIVQAFLSYFVSPWHPVRETINRFVNPMLAPIRRVLPPIGGLDFSPFVLIILLQVIRSLLINLLVAIF
ncbi:MAG: YggT family protein [Chloroflexota bacterium]|nr:MAG: YggT family protein [Chloroflexota bacterium]